MNGGGFAGGMRIKLKSSKEPLPAGGVPWSFETLFVNGGGFAPPFTNKIEIVNKTALWAVLFSVETLFIDPPPQSGGGSMKKIEITFFTFRRMPCED